MSTITIEGTDYSLVDGNYDLSTIFKKEAAFGGAIPDGQTLFSANVKAYHSDDAYRSMVQDAFDSKGENHPTLLMVSFGGPGQIASLIREARKHGVKSALRGSQAKEKPWEAKLMAVLSEVMHSAGEQYFNDNKEALFEKCGVPNDARSDSYVEVLTNSGKGNLGCRVHSEQATSKWGRNAKYSWTLAYRIDINNKTRASSKAAETNGAASAPAQSQPTA
tara:strand:- start:3005 stop:3664 length:660 start_codon:yes stop_codon:yes gene_type:complete